MAFEEKYMLRAIELAKLGVGAVNPNPLVGAVIVKDGRIIGEGYHRNYGNLHAERDALKNATESCEGAEMYVTLEPCCHYGKQPPCTEAVVSSGIKTVYVGSDDPNILVAGKGIKYLVDNGVTVYTHMMKEECDSMNEVFFWYITKKIPYVVSKYAMTMDGKIATRTGKSKWITNEKSREEVQKLRNRLYAIMVGVETVIKDDPMLNCRISGGHNPVRIICDSNLRIPMDSNIVKTAKTIRTIVATLESSLDTSKASELIESGVEIVTTESCEKKVSLTQLMGKLGEMKIDSILLEGGGTLNYSMISQGLVNEVRVFVAPKIFGGKNAVTPVSGEGIDEVIEASLFELINIEKYDEDVCLTYKRI